ncbi:C6 zinc finger domain protein [Phlyctema vagabunda]|uniref:C6 zinc finger domain protein n=1 Tax=Phlyctema vagabunda TaxID=108571 RepID=A0ABR4PTC4_9HELO
MREYSMREQGDARTLLLSCLLAVSFEIFHGNYVVGRRQTTVGLNLITRNANERKLALAANSQPVPDPIEDVLVQLFVRLDLQYLSFMEPEALHAHVSFKPPDAEKYHKMPARFSSLHEARRYWDFSVRPIMNFMNAKAIVEQREQTQNQDPLVCPFLEKAVPILVPRTEALMTPFTRVDDWEQLAPVIETTANSTSTCSTTTFSTNNSTNTASKSDQELISQWSHAFQPIYEASQSPRAKRPSRTRAALLQLRYQATVIALSTHSAGGEMQYDRLTSVYEEMVTLAAQILAHSPATRHEAVFTLDHGVVATLFGVASKCREPAVRRRAIELLELKPRREGLWEGVVAARFLRVIVDLEEDGLAPGMGTAMGMGSRPVFVPEENRIQLFSMGFDLMRRKGVLKYVRGPAAVPGNEAKLIQSVVVSW